MRRVLVAVLAALLIAALGRAAAGAQTSSLRTGGSQAEVPTGLGSLMLIAPFKVHPLWYTPILPLLFLLSAFAAGYPMVTFESIVVSKSFGRRPEMEVLTPLAKYMPVLMGLYLAVKIGDMIVRGRRDLVVDLVDQLGMPEEAMDGFGHIHRLAIIDRFARIEAFQNR